MNVEDFRQSLFDDGLLVDGGTPGVYHRTKRFERIVRGIESYVTRAEQGDDAIQLFFPPVIALSTLEGAGYMTSFPDLMGVVTSFRGNEAELPAFLESVDAGGNWKLLLTPDEVALCSATCHSVYPLLRGTTLPKEGRRYEVQAFCFRHEPSLDPARMQSFKMLEFVYVGDERGAREHRERWLERGRGLLEDLGLSVEIVPANDPFFGRAGKLLKSGQLERELKFELVSPISSEVPGAISSANYHEEHFGQSYGINAHDASVAHSACFAFGLERIALALLYKHGRDVDAWPSAVSARLAVAGEPAESR